MNASVAAMKYGWYVASCVKLPIHAPLMPRLKRATGRMQHEEAASAATIPPNAAIFWPLLREALPGCLLSAKDPEVFVALLILFRCPFSFPHPSTSCRNYRSKGGQPCAQSQMCERKGSHPGVVKAIFTGSSASRRLPVQARLREGSRPMDGCQRCTP